MENNRVRLRVQGLTSSQIQSGAYALVLSEEGLRRIPIIVGMFEAQSIAIALEKIRPERPLTHDLFLRFLEATGYEIQEVFIHKFEDNVFYSNIIMTNGQETQTIDSRTSDAIALALRARCDIYTTEAIMRKCSVVIGENTTDEVDELPEELTKDDLQDEAKLKMQLRSLKRKELEERIAKAIANENYESAKVYNDELLRREDEELDDTE